MFACLMTCIYISLHIFSIHICINVEVIHLTQDVMRRPIKRIIRYHVTFYSTCYCTYHDFEIESLCDVIWDVS